MNLLRYSELLSDAVHEGLNALGQLPRDAIYEILKTDFSMEKTDIPVRFAEFSSILKENIGTSAEPLLEFIVDRFYHGLRIESRSSIDLDQSIKQVDMIVKGDIALPNKDGRVSPTASVRDRGKTTDNTYGSIQLTPDQLDAPGVNRSIAVSRISQETDRRVLRKDMGRRYGKAKPRT